MTKINRLTRILSEYFLGTETRDFYNRQIEMVDGFIEDEQLREQHLSTLNKVRNTSVRSKYIANAVDIYSGGCLAGYLFTGDKDLLVYGLTGLASSEWFRNTIANTDRSRRRTWELISTMTRLSYNIRERSKRLREDSGEDGIDTSGYDGWYKPGD